MSKQAVTTKMLEQQGRLDEEERNYRHALMKNPKDTSLLKSLAFILRSKGEEEEALEYFGRVISFNPEDYEALYSKAHILLCANNLKEAIWYFKKAIKANPEFAHSYNSLGLALQVQGRVEEALENFRKALKLQPGHVLWRLRVDAMGPIFFDSNEQIDIWRKSLDDKLDAYNPIDLTDYWEDISSSYAIPFYYMPYQGRNDVHLHSKHASLFTQTMESLPPIVKKATNEKKHIGVIVTGKSIGVFLTIIGGMLRIWDMKKTDVTIFCYHHNVQEMVQKIDNAAINVKAFPRDFKKAVEMIWEKCLDLVYYWEIDSDSTNYFLPFFRLAPVQCTSWGTFNTTGIPFVDYFITGSLQEPADGEKHYSETLVTLPSLPAYFTKLEGSLTSRLRHRDFGLPEDIPLYLCPQALCKMHPDFYTLARLLLEKDPEGIIVLVESAKFPDWGQVLREHLNRSLRALAERIIFLPSQSKDRYFELIKLPGFLMDSLHFGGGMTALEAFSFGIPIVTLPGEFMRGRFTYACYKTMDLMECVADTMDEYVDIAMRLAHDEDYRMKLHEQIIARHDVLYENQNAAQEFQAFCIAAIDASRRGMLLGTNDRND